MNLRYMNQNATSQRKVGTYLFRGIVMNYYRRMTYGGFLLALKRPTYLFHSIVPSRMALFSKTKKLRKRPFWWNRLQQLQLKKYILSATILSFVVAVLFAWRRVYKVTLGSPAHTIQKVTFSPESVDALRDIKLYTDITQLLKGKNYYWINRIDKKDIVRSLQDTHPIVSDMNFTNDNPGELYVTIQFHEPALLFQTPSDYFISYNEHIYPVSSQSILTKQLFPVQLPGFSSWRDSINGVFWLVKEQQLQKSIEQITTTLQPSSWSTISELIYQPGWKRLFVTYKGKRIYFNLQKDLEQQLTTLQNLEEHRPWFANTRTIDVGSREEAIVK